MNCRGQFYRVFAIAKLAGDELKTVNNCFRRRKSTKQGVFRAEACAGEGRRLCDSTDLGPAAAVAAVAGSAHKKLQKEKSHTKVRGLFWSRINELPWAILPSICCRKTRGAHFCFAKCSPVKWGSKKKAHSQRSVLCANIM